MILCPILRQSLRTLLSSYHQLHSDNPNQHHAETMRKIERQMIHAINCPGKRWKNNNTQVRWSNDQTYVEVLLHDHIIASINWAKNRAVISACGWETATTKSRLNALLSDLVPGARINAKDFDWFFTYNDKTVEFASIDCTAFAI